MKTRAALYARALQVSQLVQRLCEVFLVVVEQGIIWHDDQRLRLFLPQNFKDGARS